MQWIQIAQEPTTRKAISHKNFPTCSLCPTNSDKHTMMDRRACCTENSCSPNRASHDKCGIKFKSLHCSKSGISKFFKTDPQTNTSRTNSKVMKSQHKIKSQKLFINTHRQINYSPPLSAGLSASLQYFPSNPRYSHLANKSKSYFLVNEVILKPIQSPQKYAPATPPYSPVHANLVHDNIGFTMRISSIIN